MNIEKEIELLKFQISLLKIMVQGDEFPLYHYFMDYGISEAQYKLLSNYLYLLNHRLSHMSKDEEGQQDAISSQFYELKKSSLIDEVKVLGIDNDVSFSDEIPTYDEFENFVKTALPKSVNPIYLLKCLQKHHFTNLCEYLLKQVKE